MLLDGDNVRHGLDRELGFTDADRVENIRRVGEVAKLMAEAGLIVICSFISPFRADRQMTRESPDRTHFSRYSSIHRSMSDPARPEGPLRQGKAGGIENFTGVEFPYEPPENPEIRLGTIGGTPTRRPTASWPNCTAAPCWPEPAPLEVGRRYPSAPYRARSRPSVPYAAGRCRHRL